MTWLTSSVAEKSLSHIPVGTYFLPGEFVSTYAEHIFIRPSGSLRKFEFALESVINKDHSDGKVGGLFRVKRTRVEI